MKSATAFAPATVGNVAVGFDVLGHAIDGPGDKVTATLTDTPGVTIDSVSGVATELSADPGENTAGRSLLRLIVDYDVTLGISLSIEKGIPVGSGMGGSAASAVAAVVAVNKALDLSLDPLTMIGYALDGEELTSNARNADNVAPCMLGGLVLSTTGPILRCLSIPVPDGLCAVLVHPDIRIDTHSARAVLDESISLSNHVEQSAAHALLIAGCYENDLEVIENSLRDTVIEPQRKTLIPGFEDVKNAALSHGGLGCSISGSGPSVFAWCRRDDCDSIAESMQQAFEQHDIHSECTISAVDAPGARIVSTS